LEEGVEIEEKNVQWVNELPIPIGTVIIVCANGYYLSLAYNNKELRSLILTCEDPKVYSIPMKAFKNVAIKKTQLGRFGV
jgi:hypothetical protein